MLSQIVYKYLKRNPRRFKMARKEIVEAFERHSIPTLDLFIDFQLQFGGYCPEPDEMTFGIVTPLGDDFRHDADELNDLVRVDFAVDCYVQIGFWMDEHGLIYYDHIPVAESFESYLRHRCYVDSVLDKNWTRITYDRRKTKKFRKLLDGQIVNRIEDASDQYLSVKRNAGMMWVERGDHYLELFVDPTAFYSKK